MDNKSNIYPIINYRSIGQTKLILLYWLVVQLVLTLLAPRRDRWGGLGVIGLALFGLLSGISALGEPINLEIINPATFELH